MVLNNNICVFENDIYVLRVICLRVGFWSAYLFKRTKHNSHQKAFVLTFAFRGFINQGTNNAHKWLFVVLSSPYKVQLYDIQIV